jgi:uncharacterized protein (TIGR03067 family)
VSAQALALTKGVLHTMFVTKVIMLAALAVAVGVLVGGASMLAYHALAAEPVKKTDAENIRGDWKVDSVVHDGRELAGDEADRLITNGTVKITADKFFVTVGGEDREYTYTIDATAKPRRLDLAHQLPGGGEEIGQGIYKLEGDKLTYCANRQAGADRPTAFESKEGSDIILMVLKRVKK